MSSGYGFLFIDFFLVKDLLGRFYVRRKNLIWVFFVILIIKFVNKVNKIKVLF